MGSNTAFTDNMTLYVRKSERNAAEKTAALVCQPAQIVGVGQLCGKLDLSVQLLYSHDVFWTFVPHFTGPVDDDTQRNFYLKYKSSPSLKTAIFHLREPTLEREHILAGSPDDRADAAFST